MHTPSTTQQTHGDTRDTGLPATLATALEGYASLDAEEANALAQMFLETTRKAIERRLAYRIRH